MQTYIRGLSANGSGLGVGFRFEVNDLTRDSIAESGYSLINGPKPNEPIRLLNVWICPSCNTEQWGIVDIVDRMIRRVEGVILDRKTLESAHFITEDNSGYLAETLLAETPSDCSATKSGNVDLLRQKLPQLEDSRPAKRDC